MINTELDYRKILIAYMDLVMGAESITYLNHRPPFETLYDKLTKEEQVELGRIEKYLQSHIEEQ